MQYQLNKIYNEDCYQALKKIPDNYFELAIVDPPYGIGASEMQMGSGKNKKYKKGKKWDTSTPSLDYFNHLLRVSKNQIIWGGNYFSDKLKPSRCYIFWDKGIYGDCDFSDGELAWCSFDKVLRVAKIRYKGFLGADKVRIHPTQKPITLYKWLLKNYAKKGDKILDTHLGSGSIIIACIDMGYDFIGFELDKNYFKNTTNRINNHLAQTDLTRDQKFNNYYV